MKRWFLASVLFGSSLAGCGARVDESEVGRVEVPAGLDCYRWGTSVLWFSRTQANPDFVAFSDGDLYYAGTPGGNDVLRTEGRSGTRWVASTGGALDGYISHMAPHPDGGVVAVSSQDDVISIARVDADGVASSLARIQTETMSAEHYAFEEQIAAVEDGYVLASMERPLGAAPEIVVRWLNAAGEVVWTRGAPVSADPSWALQLFRLHVSDDGVVSVVVTDDSAAEGTDAGGVRLLQWATDGAQAFNRSLSLPGNYAAAAFREDGTLTLLIERTDHVEIRHVGEDLQTLWSATPRDGHAIEGHELAWDSHTDRLLMVGENRPSGAQSNGWFTVITPEGEVEWSHTAQGDVGGATTSLVADPAGGFVMPEWRAEMRVRQFLPTTCG